MAEGIGRKTLGTGGLEVSALGLGCMNFTGAYHTNDFLPDESSLNLVRSAYSKGVSFFDTSDFYGPFTSEILIGKAIRTIPREKLQIATKFGVYLKDTGDRTKGMGVRGDPEYVRQSCEASLKRLDVDYIDLYYIHRTDGTVPIEVTMGELKKLVEEGKIKYIGLSEAAPDTIRRAHTVHPITAIQIEWSLWTRDVDDELIPLCSSRVVPTSSKTTNSIFALIQGIRDWNSSLQPSREGIFAGKASVETLDPKDRRFAMAPRFSTENLEKNKVLYERVTALAKKHGCTPGQLALAWVCSQGDERFSVVPIPGTTKIAILEENLGALKVKLTPSDLEEVAAAVPSADVAGGRYADAIVRTGGTWQKAVTPPLESWTPQDA